MPRRALLLILLVLIAIVAVATQARLSVDTLAGDARAARSTRWPIGRENLSQRIVTVQPEAEAAGVRIDDELVEVEGEPSRGRSLLARTMAGRAAGEMLNLTVRDPREGTERTLAIRLAPSGDPGPGALGWTRDIAMRIVLPVFCLLLGFWVAFVRPHDPLAWLLLALMLGFANFTADVPYHWHGWQRLAGIVWVELWRGLWPVAMMLFGVYFPDRFVVDRKLPWLKWLWIAPLSFFAVAQAAEGVGRSENETAVLPLVRTLESLEAVQMILAMTAIGMFFFLGGWKMGTATNPDARRRLVLMHVGTSISMLPLFLIIMTSLLRGRDMLEGIPRWYGIFSLLMLLLFPLTLAYVIVVQRALDVRVIIRQGMQYAFARGGVMAARVLAGIGVIVAMSFLIMRPDTRRVDILTILGAGVALIFIVGLVADRLKRWIDRRFFRDAYRADLILTELADKVGAIVETRPLLETVGRTLSETLHVPRIACWVRGARGYAPAHSLGHGEEIQSALLADDSVTVVSLRKAGRPLRIHLADPGSWVNRAGGPGPEEHALLTSLQPQLLLPFLVRDTMPGFISLGAKRSEEGYSGTDLRLLKSVATQTGFALEHSRLTEAVAAEAAQRERLSSEVEIAREVQRRLFPQRLPEVAGLDYHGACRPALGVGGDYYDFLQPRDGCLGIAIADVSGKGIGAALLMAGLQASLRSQMGLLAGDPGAVLSNVNRLIHDASPDNRYATCFFGRFDAASRSFTYVNAGHCPPLILRSANGRREVLRLKEGGTVIGLFPSAGFRAATVTLQPGDLLVAYTDGISEAMNPQDEEWGEQRLIEDAQACIGLSARETVERLMISADAFASGAPQYDDMTLVVMRLT
jgi:sigma-B regulation protein RsbU (phosphoserine phosphatase)